MNGKILCRSRRNSKDVTLFVWIFVMDMPQFYCFWPHRAGRGHAGSQYFCVVAPTMGIYVWYRYRVSTAYCVFFPLFSQSKHLFRKTWNVLFQAQDLLALSSHTRLRNTFAGSMDPSAANCWWMLLGHKAVKNDSWEPRDLNLWVRGNDTLWGGCLYLPCFDSCSDGS